VFIEQMCTGTDQSVKLILNYLFFFEIKNDNGIKDSIRFEMKI
jgi:hypothetical protein